MALGIGASLLRRWEVSDGLGVFVMDELKMFTASLGVLADAMIVMTDRATMEGEFVAVASMMASLAKLAEVEANVRKFLAEHQADPGPWIIQWRPAGDTEWRWAHSEPFFRRRDAAEERAEERRRNYPSEDVRAVSWAVAQ